MEIQNRLITIVTAVSLLTITAAKAGPFDFPAGFQTQEITTNGTTLHVRVGGSGSAVVLMHGYGESGDMWAPLAAVLMSDHTVIVPDLRGMGLSAVADKGFEKKNQAEELRASSMRSTSRVPISSATTLATWLLSPLPYNIPTGRRAWWKWTHPFPASDLGMKF